MHSIYVYIAAAILFPVMTGIKIGQMLVTGQVRRGSTLTRKTAPLTYCLVLALAASCFLLTAGCDLWIATQVLHLR